MSPTHGRDEVAWAEVRARIEAAASATQARAAVDPAQARAILEARARQLARRVATDVPDAHADFVTFTLGGETYAIDARFVLAVFRLASLTPLPGAEAPVHGITAWRGGVLTLLDLRSLRGVPDRGLADRGRVVVIGERHAAFGLLADDVRDVAALDVGTLSPVPASRAASGVVLGLTRTATIVLDAPRLLARQESDGAGHDPSARTRTT